MSDPGVASLLCRITPDALGALPLTYVREIMRPLPVTPWGDRVPAMRGTAIVRGVATRVLDAALLLGGRSQPTRFVILISGARQIALAVAEVPGFVHLDPDMRRRVTLFDARVATLATIDPGLPGVLLAMSRISDDPGVHVTTGAAAQ